MTNTCIFNIVISKLSYRQEPSPVILFKIHKNFKISFHCALLSLILVISLQIKAVENFWLILRK